MSGMVLMQQKSILSVHLLLFGFNSSLSTTKKDIILNQDLNGIFVAVDLSRVTCLTLIG